MGKHHFENTATQVQYPWKTTLRTVFQAFIGFASMWALIVEALGLDPALPWVAASLAVTAAITRVMALGVVDDWLGVYVPWLASGSREHEVLSEVE